MNNSKSNSVPSAKDGEGTELQFKYKWPKELIMGTLVYIVCYGVLVFLSWYDPQGPNEVRVITMWASGISVILGLMWFLDYKEQKRQFANTLYLADMIKKAAHLKEYQQQLEKKAAEKE